MHFGFSKETLLLEPEKSTPRIETLEPEKVDEEEEGKKDESSCSSEEEEDEDSESETEAGILCVCVCGTANELTDKG